MQHLLTQGRIWGILTLGLGLTVWLAASSFPEMDAGYPDPALFPNLIAFGLCFAGLFLFFSGGTDSKLATFQFSGTGWWQAIVLVVLVALIPLVAERVGFIPTVGVLVFCVGMLFRTKLWVSALTALITSGLIYLIFVLLLNVPL